jgi:diguanylate cyclase (GGDEF)-like protein
MHFSEHAQHALAQVHERDAARHHRRFDELTGLPNASHLRERVEEEIARSAGRGRPLVLVRLQVAGLGERLDSQREDEGDRLVLAIAQELRAELRDFDVLARTAPDTFEILIPEPDADVSSLLGPLARRAHEAIRSDPEPDLIDRTQLRFGYAVYPEDGATSTQLFERARTPRIESD